LRKYVGRDGDVTSQYEQGIGGYYGGLDFDAALLDAVRAPQVAHLKR
jgi:hypothetical protein